MKRIVIAAYSRLKSDPKQQKRVQEIVLTSIALSFFYLDPTDKQLLITMGLILLAEGTIKLARRISRRKQLTPGDSSDH